MRKSIRWVAAVSATLALVACGKKTQSENAVSAGADSMAAASPMTDTANRAAAAPQLNDANIAALLDEANAADSAAGKIASTKGSNADVKAFGQQMMRDHHTLRKQGQDLAKKLNLTPQPPANDTIPSHASKMADSLNKMPKGKDWDRFYIDHEVSMHQAVLSLLSSAQGAAQNAELKDLIQKATPNVQAHLAKAQQIQSKLGGATASASGTGTTGTASTGGAYGASGAGPKKP